MKEVAPSTNLEQALQKSLRDTIGHHNHYPGYPTKRLSAENPDVARQLTEGAISLLPEGAWNTGYNSLHHQTTEDLRLLRLQGYLFDKVGRPLHPWLNNMLKDSTIGVVTGTGTYWKMGPNKTADPIVITTENNPRVLLVQRNDNKNWAFAGGYVDMGEAAIETARREALEETGVRLDNPPVAIVYDGVVADARTTAYAWPETTAVLWRVTRPLPLTIDENEVDDAGWFYLTDLPLQLHGSHGVLLRQTVQRYLEQ